MTIVDVLAIVREETGQDVTPETKLETLHMDSLEFLNLLTRLSIPDAKIEDLETVGDLMREIA